MIFDRMAPHYGPRQDFGARHQFVADPAAMADMGGGVGRPFNGGMYTGGDQRPHVGLPQMVGPGQVFPMQGPWMPSGYGQPQSSLGRWFNTFRQGAYR